MKKLISVITLLSLITPVYAANDTATLSAASTLLKEGQPSDALAFLLVEHDPEMATTQEWFLLGLAAKQSGQLEDASKYFEKVLEIDLKADRVKLELAAISYQLGNRDRAKLLLLDVKASNPPAGVASNIDRFLATIEASAGQKNWRVSASAGWIYDSNVNAGPNEDIITLFGLPFNLSNDAQNTEDNAYTLGLSFDQVVPVNGSVGWQSHVGVNWRDNFTVNTLDSLYLSGSTGPVWKQNSKLIWTLPIIADWVRYGHKDDYFSFSYGIAPQVRYFATNQLALNLGTSVRGKSYDKQSLRKQLTWTITPSVDYQLTESDLLRLGVTGGQEHSGINFYSNDRWFVNAGYFHNFSKYFVASLNGSFGESFYQGKEAAYNRVREDTRSSIGVDLRYHVAMINTDIVTSASYTNNESNLAIYEYDQTQVSVNLITTF